MTSPANTGVALSTLYRYIPALDSLRSYRFSHFRADFVAGLTVATVAVPQAMAYALVAGVPPEYGLYTAIVMTAVGAVFDSSRQLINGPTNAISIAVLSAVAIIPPEDRLQAAILLAFLVGLLQVGITLAKLGDLTRYISHSVIVGFTLVQPAAGTGPVEEPAGPEEYGPYPRPLSVLFWATTTQGGPPHWLTVQIGLGSIALVVVLRWLRTRSGSGCFPICSSPWPSWRRSAPCWAWKPRACGLWGSSRPNCPPWRSLTLTPLTFASFPPALAIATLGLLEAISMAKAIAAHTRQKIDFNQQCLSEGLANLSGSFFRCIPGSGSLTRSFINQQAGAVTQWSGVISAFAVAMIVLAFCALCQVHPPGNHGGHPDDFVLVHGGLEAARIPRAGLAL